MEYQLTAEVSPPADTADLDALHRLGVAALLDEHLELLAGIEGPDGVEIEPIDHEVAVQPTGAVITWLLEAPALAAAEEGARHVLGEVLERTELLAGWSVRRCEVIASDEDLAAALEDDADLDLDLDLGLDGDGADAELSDEDRAARRAELLDAAEQLRAFGLDVFGHDAGDAGTKIDEEHARLLAGALIQGVEVLTDELFQDIQALEEADTPASEHDVLWVLDQLPERYAELYDALFAKRFLVATTILGYRLCQPGWTAPSSTAEALALHLLKSKAQIQLDLADVGDALPRDEMLAILDERVFADLDHETLYELPADDTEPAAGLAFDDWFHPRHGSEGSPHPYLTDEPSDPELV